jgi:O-antigen ligase
VLNPELAGVHNSFLQQLFDGGVLGVALLGSATMWASYRASNQIFRSNSLYTALTTSLAMLLFYGISETFTAPGSASQPFWALVVFIGITCQRLDNEFLPKENS